MRRILPILVVAIVLFNCSEPPSLIPEKLIASGYDFSEYSEKGFLFTPNEYSGDYESIGLIQLTYSPEARLSTVSEHIPGVGKKERTQWITDPINADKVIEDVYNLCIEMGADALTQMKIEPYSENHAQGTMNPLTLSGIKISGFAIRRLGALK